MGLPDWNIEELTGYKPHTTFYMDFSIADRFGVDAIKDTYQRAFNDWKNDTVYLTELVMVLNWKSWEHYGKGHEQYTAVYTELYEELNQYALDNLQGDDLSYYVQTTD